MGCSTTRGGTRHSFDQARRVIGLGCLWALFQAPHALATDWPQWCGSDTKNLVSAEKALPNVFVPGEKDSQSGLIKPGTAKNVKWARKLCQAMYSTPVVAGGRIFVGGRQGDQGLLMCLEEPTGRLLWQWQGPAKEVPYKIGGWIIGISVNPHELGVCSSPTVEGDRVYFVTHSFQVLCLDVKGQPAGPEAGKARIVWKYDLWDELGVFPCDAANGSPLIDGDLLYVPTSNGIDHNMDPYREKNRKMPAPAAPNLIVLDKNSGRLVATDDTSIAAHMLHGQWSSPSLGSVHGRKLVFFGGGDGRCYAFAALGAHRGAAVPAARAGETSAPQVVLRSIPRGRSSSRRSGLTTATRRNTDRSANSIG